MIDNCKKLYNKSYGMRYLGMVIDNITHGWYNSDKLVKSQQLNRYIGINKCV